MVVVACKTPRSPFSGFCIGILSIEGIKITSLKQKGLSLLALVLAVQFPRMLVDRLACDNMYTHCRVATCCQPHNELLSF